MIFPCKPCVLIILVQKCNHWNYGLRSLEILWSLLLLAYLALSFVLGTLSELLYCSFNWNIIYIIILCLKIKFISFVPVCVCVLVGWFEAGSHVAKASPNWLYSQIWPWTLPEFWDCKCVPPCLALWLLFLKITVKKSYLVLTQLTFRL